MGPLALVVVGELKLYSRFVVVEGVGVVVVGGVGSVQSLQPLLLFLHKVGVGASAGGGHPCQPAVGPWLIPGWDGWRRGRRSGGRRGYRSRYLCRDRDRSRAGSWSRGRDRDGGHTGAVVGVVAGRVVVVLLVMLVAVVEGDGGGRLGNSLVLAVVLVVVVVVLGRNGRRCGLSRWRWRRRRRKGWLGRRRRGRRDNWLPVQTQVLVLLAEPVQLDLQLLDTAPLCFQKLLLALNDVVELQKVLHGPVGALGAALAGSLTSIHG